MERASTGCAAVTLEEKVRFLASAAAWPEAQRPDVIETHMSWVFLGEGSVLKLKKPVRTGFLDFSTLAAREFNCREEVRLNLRLAPGVYLGVLPLPCAKITRPVTGPSGGSRSPGRRLGPMWT